VPSAPSSVQPAQEASGPPVAAGQLDAFISYRRLAEDVEFVDWLAARLAALGKRVWVDRSDIEPAADWRERVERGLQAAKALIFLITPESIRSEECLWELATARAHHKLVVPVLRRDVPREALPEELARPNWIFFRASDDAEEALAKLVEALEADLEWRDAHARLVVRTAEWARSGRDRSFLLRGSDLRSAEEWVRKAGEHPKTPPTALQLEYILVSRKAADRNARTWQAALATGLAVSVALGALALVKDLQATHEARVSESNALAAEATVALSTNPQESVSLALRSARLNVSPSTEQALRLALSDGRMRMAIRSAAGPATTAAWAPGKAEVAVSAPGGVELWGTLNGRLLQNLAVPRQYPVSQLLFDPSGKELAAVSSVGHVTMWKFSGGGAEVPVDTAGLNSEIGRLANCHLPCSFLELKGAWDAWPGPHGASLWWAGGAEELDLYGSSLSNVVRFDPQAGTVRPLFRCTQRGGCGAGQLAVSPDGRELFVDGEVVDFAIDREWQVPGAVGDSMVPGPACWYPDGSLVVTSSAVEAGAPVHFWGQKSGHLVAEMQTPTGPTTAVACSSSAANPWAAAADAQGDVLLRTAEGAVLPLYGHSDSVEAIATSPDGRFLATASLDGTARIWDALTGRQVALLAGDGAGLSEVSFDGDGGLVLTVDTRGVVRIWDTSLGAPLSRLARVPRRSSVALGFTANGSLVYGVAFRAPATAKGEMTAVSLVTWGTASGRLRQEVPLSGLQPAAVPCTGYLKVIGGYAGWPIAGTPARTQRCSLPLPASLAVAVELTARDASGFSLTEVEPLALAVSADGRYFAYSKGSSVIVGELGRKAPGPVATLPFEDVSGLAFSDAGPSGSSRDRLLVVTPKAVSLWAKGRLLTIRQPSPPLDAELSADESALATACSGGEVYVWDAADGRLVASFTLPPAPTFTTRTGAPTRVALDADGGVVAAGDAAGRVFAWDVVTKRRLAEEQVPSSGDWPISELTTSGDGSRFLAADWPQAGTGTNPPGSAVVLDAATGRELATLLSPATSGVAPVNPGAALNSNGSLLFAGALGLAPAAPGGTEAVWQLSTGEDLAGLQGVSVPAASSYATSPAEPWSPSGTRLIVGDAVYACDACGSLSQLEAVAQSRLAWGRALSAGADHPPSSNPYG
jgi:WD40 repeat protein